MNSFILGVALLLVSVVAASASECPKLQAQIDKELGQRFDGQAAVARAAAAEANALHKAGSHAESVKKYDEAAKAAGMKLEHKK